MLPPKGLVHRAFFLPFGGKLMTGREAIIERLAQKNEDFARMVREHAELDRQVSELERRVHLSTDEEIELKRIKKLKLAGKDRIEAMLATYR